MNKEPSGHGNRTSLPPERPGEAFRLRAYGRTELAQAYNPHLAPSTAWHRLRSWIAQYPGLMQRLEKTGYSSRKRTWTPLQVRLIVEALGEP
nr:DUF4248 domain-containing protein [Prevotella denticola]